MTYQMPRSAPLNDDITRFTSVDLNSGLQPKYIADYFVCKIILGRLSRKNNIGSIAFALFDIKGKMCPIREATGAIPGDFMEFPKAG